MCLFISEKRGRVFLFLQRKNYIIKLKKRTNEKQSVYASVQSRLQNELKNIIIKTNSVLCGSESGR